MTLLPLIRFKWQARRDSNPQHPVLETGALAVRATGLHARNTTQILFSFLVRSVFATKAAILAEFQLSWNRFFILGCCIVFLFALSAAKRNYISHLFIPLVCTSHNLATLSVFPVIQ